MSRDAKRPAATGGARSAARLAAVQALYQMEQNPGSDPVRVAAEFRAHRLGQEVEGEHYTRADAALFDDVVTGAAGRRAEIDGLLVARLDAGWPLDRLDSVLRAILRAGAWELLARPDIPTAVIIDEYVDVAHAFFEGQEPRFANGVLDRLARGLRGDGG